MGDSSKHESLLREQIAYYRAREYDEWFLRQGRYDRGPELNRRWFDEVAEVRQALAAFNPTGHVLELACGTGLWTEPLLRQAARITAVDASPEVQPHPRLGCLPPPQGYHPPARHRRRADRYRLAGATWNRVHAGQWLTVADPAIGVG